MVLAPHQRHSGPARVVPAGPRLPVWRRTVRSPSLNRPRSASTCRKRSRVAGSVECGRHRPPCEPVEGVEHPEAAGCSNRQRHPGACSIHVTDCVASSFTTCLRFSPTRIRSRSSLVAQGRPFSPTSGMVGLRRRASATPPGRRAHRWKQRLVEGERGQVVVRRGEPHAAQATKPGLRDGGVRRIRPMPWRRTSASTVTTSSARVDAERDRADHAPPRRRPGTRRRPSSTPCRVRPRAIAHVARTSHRPRPAAEPDDDPCPSVVRQSRMRSAAAVPWGIASDLVPGGEPLDVPRAMVCAFRPIRSRIAWRSACWRNLRDSVQRTAW